MADDSLENQLSRLAAIVAPLAETVNQHDARLARQDAINERLALAIERIETLLARLPQQGPNGRDA